MNTVCHLRGIDVLRRHEEHSLLIPSRKLPAAYASFDRNHYDHDHRPTKDPLWYQCGMCQKTFVTRFYLDRHMMLHHHQDELFEPNTTRLLCPAQHWCHFLVDCHDVAVEMESYYRAGGGMDWQTVASLVQQRIPPCHEETLQTTLRACRTMVDTCFSHHESLHEYLQRHLCAPQTCQDRLHRILFQSSSSLGLSSLRMKHTEWRMLYAFLLTSALVVGFVFVYFYRDYVQRRRPRSRLLQKPRHTWFRYLLYNSTNHRKQKVS